MEFLKKLGIKELNAGSSTGLKWFDADQQILESFSPVDGKKIASVTITSRETYDQVITKAQQAFLIWRTWPAPKRGEIVRQIGQALRDNKHALGSLVSYEMGKSLQEGLGEVQEMIDICDFAVGLSRQLHGLTMHSERPAHRMYEQWHALGIVGIISAFNFPVAVWSWNSMLAWVCGNVSVWKASEKTPLCSLACQLIISDIFKKNEVPEGVSCIITGSREAGEWMSSDERIPLVSATGSTRMGKSLSAVVAGRLGRSLLELGGNNAIIITENADLNIAVLGAVFGAVGTAGQRCTSTRRLIIQEGIYERIKARLVSAYGQLKIGDPLNESNHVGPLIDKSAVHLYEKAIEICKSQGGNFIVEGGILSGDGYESGCYVRPCIAEASADLGIVAQETFAPILYLLKYKTIEEAIEIQNSVPQGPRRLVLAAS